MLKFILLSATAFLLISGHTPACFLSLNKGTSTNCANSGSIKYHFDPKLNQCHAFKYLGCGGNKNNHETPGECMEKCLGDPKKYFLCSLGKPPVFNSKGDNECPLDSTDSGEGCESDEATCVNFYTRGMCCNKTVEFGLKDDLSATCLSGKPRWQIDGTTVLTKSCGEVTCPSGYSCKVGNFFSYCCQN